MDFIMNDSLYLHLKECKSHLVIIIIIMIMLIQDLSSNVTGVKILERWRPFLAFHLGDLFTHHQWNSKHSTYLFMLMMVSMGLDIIIAQLTRHRFVFFLTQKLFLLNCVVVVEIIFFLYTHYTTETTPTKAYSLVGSEIALLTLTYRRLLTTCFCQISRQYICTVDMNKY